MESQPLISVIIPVYKAEKYLPACLDSVLAQTYRNLEIILIDDGSPDNSGKICDSYAERDSRICVIHQENAGVSAARNAGLDAASGDYIGFVDADDYIKPDMYEALFKRLQECGADIAQCGHSRISLDGTVICEIEAEQAVLDRKSAIKELLVGDIHYSDWDKLYRRGLFDGVRFDLRVSYGEDLLLNYQVLKHCERVALLKGSYYFYVQNPLSASYDCRKKYSFPSKYIMEDIRREYPDLADDAHWVHCSWLAAFYEQAHPRLNRQAKANWEERKKLRAWALGELRRELFKCLFNRACPPKAKCKICLTAVFPRLYPLLLSQLREVRGVNQT